MALWKIKVNGMYGHFFWCVCPTRILGRTRGGVGLCGVEREGVNDFCLE